MKKRMEKNLEIMVNIEAINKEKFMRRTYITTLVLILNLAGFIIATGG